MNTASQEHRRTVVSSGTYAEGSANKKLDRSPYPFAQQVDLVFPSEPLLEEKLASPTTTYWSCHSTLTKFVKYASSFVDRFEMKSDIMAVSAYDATMNSSFSLDSRGILTVVVDKLVYESLGLVGSQMRWKGCDHMYMIQCVLRESVPDDPATRKLHRYGPKQEAALAAWDAEHEPWHILYYIQESGPNPAPFEGAVEHHVKASVSQTPIAHAPEPVLRPYPGSAEEREDWDEDCSDLFEWVGMASLGSQRLIASDRCDPYIAVYTPPGPTRMTNITRVRWHGLLSSVFTQSLVDAVLKVSLGQAAFLALTVHGVSVAPVAYISPYSPLKTPMRLPRPESEDTWTLLASSHSTAQSGMCNWVLAESIGKWDARWG